MPSENNLLQESRLDEKEQEPQLKSFLLSFLSGLVIGVLVPSVGVIISFVAGLYVSGLYGRSARNGFFLAALCLTVFYVLIFLFGTPVSESVVEVSQA